MANLAKKPTQITLKDGASADDLEKAREQAKSQGGEIKDEFTLIKGFTVNFPDDAVHTLASNDEINVEQDGEVTTQLT